MPEKTAFIAKPEDAVLLLQSTMTQLYYSLLKNYALPHVDFLKPRGEGASKIGNISRFHNPVPSISTTKAGISLPGVPAFAQTCRQFKPANYVTGKSCGTSVAP